MFNIDLIRNDKENVKNKLKQRNVNVDLIDEIYNLDIKNRELKTKIQDFNFEKNKLSKDISIAYANNDIDKAKQLQQKSIEINKEIEKINQLQININNDVQNKLSYLPNLCDDSVNFGKDENDNIELKHYLTPTKFDFEPLAHWDLATKNKLIDFNAATKISGSRFILYTNLGARLFRALQQFSLDHNIECGFVEMLPPTIINAKSLYSTGQLPKFENDVYKLINQNNDMYLSPTAEVQLVNIKRDEIIDFNDLPLRYTANTPCYRSEAGSAGRDTRGVIRQHQFWKTELVSICNPENSVEEHEKITRVAETILEKLKLPYRRILLCTGDTGFSSSKTFDIEVWLPSYNQYKEISSCSNCLDFQARRSNIRTKDKNNKTIYVHTLNGSSLAIDRLWAAVVENYQQKDGSIIIPEALVPYMNNIKEIKYE